MKETFPMIDKEKTGRRIKEFMELRGLSVRDVQQYFGFSTQQAVYHWLNGRSLPSIDNMYALSALLKVPMDDLICGNKEESVIDSAKVRRLRLYAEYIERLKAA